MTKRDALNAARILDKAREAGIFPEDTEVTVIRREADWGVRLELEGHEVNYFQEADVTRFLKEYREKLARSELEI